MANEPIITLVGNLTGDPELRFTPSGAAVANFTVAQTPRVKDGEQWVDGEAMFVRCAAWRDLAENVAESLVKGTRVIVQGRLTQRSYEHNGEKRTSLELEVDAVGPDLRWASAQVQRRQSGGGGQGYGNRQQSGGQSRGQSSEPWAQGGGSSDPWASPATDEPPF